MAGLMRRFASNHGKVYGVPFDYPSAVLWIERVLKIGLCLVGPSSCAGAVLCPFSWNQKVVKANVEFWYFVSAREITILDSLLVDCWAHGATHAGVSSHHPANTIGRRYEGSGLLAVETYHIGPIGKSVAMASERGKSQL